MTMTLEPCPFCGKNGPFDEWPCEWLDGNGENVVRCPHCHGAAPMATWNRRIHLTQPAQEWRDIASAPKGKPILVHYKNELGKGRTVKAYYVERFTEESSPDSESDEYNEADDTYYTLPGWYEMIDNWEDYSAVFIHRDPTLWMPLPTPPTDGEG